MSTIYNHDQVYNESLKYFKGDELAASVFANKYSLKDSFDNLYELTPDDMHRRLAKEFARIESKYVNPMSEEEIYDLIKNFRYIIPQGSPMSGIGNDNQIVSLSNCFVIGNEADSYGGIIQVDEEQVNLMKRRGGVGHDLSHIRPKGTPVKNSALTSTGIVPFMERYSNSTREVAQDGRRGALMLSISSKHPDAEAFIDAKLEVGKITGANVSVRIDDEFMRSVINSTPYIQQFPINSETPKVLKEIDSKKLWEKIIHNTWKSAEPGVLFWDTIIRESVPDCYADQGYKTVSTNPCLPSDTWIFTSDGARQIKDLIGKPFRSTTNGVEDYSTNDGFFYTGNKQIFKIITKKGYTLRGTDNHKIKIVQNKSRHKKDFTWCEIKDLKIGDNLVLNNNHDVKWSGEGNFETGWLLGNFVGDGNSSENNYMLKYWGTTNNVMKEQAVSFIQNNLKHRSDLGCVKNYDTIVKSVKSSELKNVGENFGIYSDKTINNEIVEKCSYDFYKGFISGLFDADGTVLNNKEKGINVRLSSSKLELLQLVQRMLSRMGIISTVYKNRRDEHLKEMPNGKGGVKEYPIQSQHELMISKSNVLVFKDIINFTDEEKYTKLDLAILSLDKRGLYSESFDDEIISIVNDGYSDVYDCQIISSHEFDANGIVVHNCGEIPLCPYDSCRLIAINLYSYVENPFTPQAKFNFELFKQHVTKAQRMMDDLIDLEVEKINTIIEKVISDPEPDDIKQNEIKLWEKIKQKSITGRRTGLGITAEGDMLAAIGLKYGTPEATKFAVEVQKTLAITAYKSSSIMAKERGAFPIYNFDKESKNPFINRLIEADSELGDMLKQCGRRNIALLTIAPTGSVSIMTQTTSGIEPTFMIAYKRRKKINPNDKNAKSLFVDKNGDHWEEYSVSHPKFIKWLKVNGYDVEKTLSLPEEELNEIIKLTPYYGATSDDVDWVEKVRMQGEMQKWVDHSISVTVNLPKDVSEETVNKIYLTAWESGCKGVTIYRDGSRDGVLISDKDKKEIEKINKIFSDKDAPKRPKRLKGEIMRFQNNLEKWIAVVGFYEGRPYEIFTGKLENGLSKLSPTVKECEIVKNIVEEDSLDANGNVILDANGEVVKIKKKRYDIEYVDSEGNLQKHTGLNHAFNKEFWNYAKLISGIMRHGMPMIYLVELIDSLNFNEDYINTWKNGVIRVMKKYIKDGEKAKGKCVVCGSEHLEYKEGCLTCMGCGSSKCS